MTFITFFAQMKTPKFWNQISFEIFPGKLLLFSQFIFGKICSSKWFATPFRQVYISSISQNVELKTFLFSVQEIKYEKVLASTDGIDIKSSKEFSFVITPSTDYFTT